jgi:predicted ATPase
MSSLNRIEIDGFKSIKSMSIDLTKLNVLIGANGAGKSNFVSIFELLNQMVENNLQLFVGKAGGVR